MNTMIEEIRKRIKARMDNTDAAGDYDEYADGQGVGLAAALRIIDEVEKEHPIPSDVQEASKNYADEQLAGHNRELSESGHTRHFKMGYVCFAGYEIEGAFADGMLAERDRLMKEAEKPCHTVEEWMEHIKNADELTKAIFSKGPYDVLYDALNRPYRDCYDAIKEFGELCYQTARQEMMKDAVECEIGWSDGYRIALADEKSMNEALAKIGVLDQVCAGVDANVSVIIIKKEK